MKTIVVAVALLVTQLASAAPALIESLPRSAIADLEAKIKASVEKKTGFKNLKNYKVRWSEIKSCLEARNEMDDSKLMGACAVTFGAFQVYGESLIVVSENGYAATILYLNVE